MIGAGLAADRKMANHFDYATHAQVLRDHPSFDWLAVVDPSPEARRAAESWGVPIVVPTVRELPATLRPEVVVIATKPNERDPELAKLNGLKLVILEKPLAHSAKAAAALLSSFDERLVAVQVNLFRRAEATTRSLSLGGLEDRIGDPQAVFGVYGNGLRNNAVHMIDLVRMLLGEVKKVHALGPITLLDNASVPGDISLPFALTLDTNVCATLQPLDFSHYREVGLDIWGTRGRLEILQEGLLTRVSSTAPHRALETDHEIACDRAKTLSGEYSRALYSLYDNAAEWLANGTPLVSPGTNALTNEVVLDAVVRSANAGGTAISVTSNSF